MPKGKKQPLAERFWMKVDRSNPDGCWEWTACKVDGYGRIQSDAPEKRTLHAHRVSYEINVGPIPDGLSIDHLCRNKGCVNPDHLEVVHIVENLRRAAEQDGRRAYATHCPKGHPYGGENLYTYKDKRGYVHRVCRTCRYRYKEAFFLRHPERAGSYYYHRAKGKTDSVPL